MLTICGFIVFAIGAVANNGGGNYAGTGNRYVIDATVTEVTDHSVFVSNIHVVGASGAARSWFKSAGNIWSANHSELQDRFTDDGGHEHIVGQIGYQSDADIGADIWTLTPGTRIQAEGVIGDSKVGKYSRTEARFLKIIIFTSS
jgi:hypothetical protein